MLRTEGQLQQSCRLDAPAADTSDDEGSYRERYNASTPSLEEQLEEHLCPFKSAGIVSLREHPIRTVY